MDKIGVVFLKNILIVFVFFSTIKLVSQFKIKLEITVGN